MTVELVARVPTACEEWFWWYRARFALLWDVLSNELRYSPEQSAVLAGAVMGLWVREVGWRRITTGEGRGCLHEWNFNAGNIHGSFQNRSFASPEGNARSRAYPSRWAATVDSVAVMSTGIYRAAWDALAGGVIGSAEWYGQVLQAGYAPFSEASVAEYQGVLDLIPRRNRERYTG